MVFTKKNILDPLNANILVNGIIGTKSQTKLLYKYLIAIILILLTGFMLSNSTEIYSKKNLEIISMRNTNSKKTYKPFITSYSLSVKLIFAIAGICAKSIPSTSCLKAA